MTEEKICPFITRVTQFGDIERHEYIVSCKKEKCMAWEPAGERMVYAETYGSVIETLAHGKPFKSEVIPAHCKLIDK